MKTRLLVALLFLSTINDQPSTCFAQGNLTPLGPPAPTMKALDEIEPRINIQRTINPLPTDANYHYIISSPGSYYLTANLEVTKSNGILINAEGVTLDLNGFQISRTSGSAVNGIEITIAGHRASVRNGSIKGFAYGLSGTLASGSAFRDLAVSGCTNTGIAAGEGAVLESCRAHDNSGSYGIHTDSGSTLANCTASKNTTAFGISAGQGSSLTNCAAANNTTAYGIFAGSGSSLTNCSAFNNKNSGSTSAGIGTSVGCTITHCTAYGNTSTAATSTPTTGMGFEVGEGTIQGCTARDNEGDGINISSNSLVRDNQCEANGSGLSEDGAGIHVTGSANRIEANNVTNNKRGIEAGGMRNFIARNTARTNAKNYVIVAGNRIAQIVVPAVNGANITDANSGSTDGFTAVDPWANFSF